MTDHLCKKCYRYFQSRLCSHHEVEEDCNYVPQEVVTQIKECISLVDIDVTPQRNPGQLKRSMDSYAPRKDTKVDEAFSKTTRWKISGTYNADNTKPTSQSCVNCCSLCNSVREAFQKVPSHQQGFQILTLLPECLTTKQIVKLVPEATNHLTDKTC